MTSVSDAAAAVFAEGYNCAQSVLAGCGEQFGLPKSTAIQVAQAFGGGMGSTGNVCGAVTGAMMTIGLKCSMRDGSDKAAKAQARELTREFLSRFRAEHGTMLCRELLGCDLSTPEGHTKAAETGVFKTICPGLIRDAARLVQDVLAQTPEMR